MPISQRLTVRRRGTTDMAENKPERVSPWVILIEVIAIVGLLFAVFAPEVEHAHITQTATIEEGEFLELDVCGPVTWDRCYSPFIFDGDVIIRGSLRVDGPITPTLCCQECGQ